MKKTLVFIFLICFVLFSCEMPEEDSGPDLVSSPEAQPEDDNAATGVYKGVLADDDLSGTYKITISESAASGSMRAAGDTYTAVVEIEVNGSSTTFNGSATEQNGGSFLLDLEITVGGIVVGLDMDISPTGTINDVNAFADGYYIETEVVKETSTTLVEAWEGSFTGDADGIWNFISYGGNLLGVFSGPYAGSGSFEGTLTENSVTAQSNDGQYIIAAGSINGNSGSGTWFNTDSGYSGTWSGSRTR